MSSQLIDAPTTPGQEGGQSGVRQLFEVKGSYYLLLLVGSGAGRRFSLANDVVIGRDFQCVICVESTEVSREHVRISQTPEGFLLEDLQSRNGTFINGQPVQKQLLSVGDKIQVATSALFLFTFHSELEEQFVEERTLQATARLAGGIAHDFNNLMAAILVDIDSLRRFLVHGEFSEEEALQCLDNMQHAARRAADLTSQLLGFARRGKYENRLIDFTLLLQESLDLARRSMDNAIEVLADFQPRLGVVGDPAQLQQILLHLCYNAQDAMPRGGQLILRAGLMRIHSEGLIRSLSQVPGEYVLLQVQDTGEGMDEETCSKIFEPFFTTKKIGKGRGLGLASIYGIIKNHAGQIEVKSQVDKGTLFSVYLPAVRLPEEGSNTRPTSEAKPAVRGTILLVEDVDLERSTLVRLLNHLGYRVIEAKDGLEAVKIFKEQREGIALVLLDMILPNLNGREVFRWLRKIDPQIKVIVTSGYLDEGRISEMMAEGATGFLEKPAKAEEIKKAIESALDST